MLTFDPSGERPGGSRKVSIPRPISVTLKPNMKKISMMLAGAALAMATNAWSAPLATYTHTYGKLAGQVDPGGNDVLGFGYVSVSDRSSQRFNDSFDFSGLNYGAITSFDLTLNYERTNDIFAVFFPEAWYVRPGSAPSGNAAYKLNRVGLTRTSTTFRIDSSLSPYFRSMVAAENFYFWMADQALGANTFKLHSAKLAVNGTARVSLPVPSPVPLPVPEPGSMALLGAGLLGLGLIRRRRSAK